MHTSLSLLLSSFAVNTIAYGPAPGNPSWWRYPKIPESCRNFTGANDFAVEKHYLAGLMHNYEEQTFNVLNRMSSSSCNANTIGVRRAWDDISDEERTDYINAVHCLAKLPSRNDPKEVPGARNWIDDFVWQHIQQTNYIHSDGLLLPWHRQFIAAWENALRTECGYKGYLPYWPWERHALNQKDSPVFNANGTSGFGGNGISLPHDTVIEPFLDLPTPLNLTKTPGTGGGNVTDGPFSCSSGWTLNIGPVTPVNNTFYGTSNTMTPNNTYGQQYNPRCLRRDFSQQYTTESHNYTTIATALSFDSIHDFRPFLDSSGIHPGGHFFVGMDAGDIYSSPNEPVFWLHHSSLDRLWTIWQAQDFATRGEALDGTVTISNIPPSENATVDTIMQMGIPAGGEKKIGSVMQVPSEGHCYMYM